MLRTLSLLALCTLPLAAQDKPVSDADNLFYRAFFLERGQRDYAKAIQVYEQFLAAAPSHRFANRAARSTYGLLTRLERSDEAAAFAEAHSAVLAMPAPAVVKSDAKPATEAGTGEPAAGRGASGQRGQAGRRGGRRGQGNRRGGQRGQRGGGGRGGRRGGRGGAFGILSSEQKLAEMDDEQIAEFRSSLEQLAGFTDRMRQNGQEERAEQLEKAIKSINASLDAGKTEDAQKALDELRESFRRR